MINYPVKSVSPPLPEYMHYVVDSTGVQIAECDSRSKADAICNALNAMNEFPGTGSASSCSVEDALGNIIDWQKKYFQ